MTPRPPDAPVRLVDLGAVSPLRSQALYHALAASMDEAAPDTIVLCRPAAPYFCVGYHQTPGEELDLDWCGERGFPVIQRRIGGGTVLCDRDQLFYQCVFHRRRAPFAVDAIFRHFLGPAVRTLQGLGLGAVLEAVNEIEVDGRRIAGTGGGQIGEAIVVVGNLLLDFPVATMARGWRVPSEPFRRLAEEGLRRHIATLASVLGQVPAETEIRRRLVGAYEAGLGRPLRAGGLSPVEEAAVVREERRLDQPGEPRPGGPPRRPRRLKLTRRAWVQEWLWPMGGGLARVTARMADGRIEALEVQGAGLERREAERRVAAALESGGAP